MELISENELLKKILESIDLNQPIIVGWYLPGKSERICKIFITPRDIVPKDFVNGDLQGFIEQVNDKTKGIKVFTEQDKDLASYILKIVSEFLMKVFGYTTLKGTYKATTKGGLHIACAEMIILEFETTNPAGE